MAERRSCRVFEVPLILQNITKHASFGTLKQLRLTSRYFHQSHVLKKEFGLRILTLTIRVDGKRFDKRDFGTCTISHHPNFYVRNEFERGLRYFYQRTRLGIFMASFENIMEPSVVKFCAKDMHYVGVEVFDSWLIRNAEKIEKLYLHYPNIQMPFIEGNKLAKYNNLRKLVLTCPVVNANEWKPTPYVRLGVLPGLEKIELPFVYLKHPYIMSNLFCQLNLENKTERVIVKSLNKEDILDVRTWKILYDHCFIATFDPDWLSSFSASQLPRFYYYPYGNQFAIADVKELSNHHVSTIQVLRNDI